MEQTRTLRYGDQLTPPATIGVGFLAARAVELAVHDEPLLHEDYTYMAANRLLKDFDRYDIAALAATEHRRQVWLQRADPLHLFLLASHINQVLLGASGLTVSGDTVPMGGMIWGERTVNRWGVAPQYRSEVFGRAVEAVHDFAEQGDLHAAGSVLANILVGMQVWQDGNKRTARALYQLIAEGYDAQPAARKRYHKALAYTREARNGFHSVVLDERPRTSYLISVLPNPEADVRKFTAFIKVWDSYESPEHRLTLGKRLEGITDSRVRSRVMYTLQQVGFGSSLVFAGAAELRTSPTIPAMIEAAGEYLSSLDEPAAEALLQQDALRKKEFFIRLIDSTTGRRPLPIYNETGTRCAGQFESLA